MNQKEQQELFVRNKELYKWLVEDEFDRLEKRYEAKQQRDKDKKENVKDVKFVIFVLVFVSFMFWGLTAERWGGEYVGNGVWSYPNSYIKDNK